MQAEIKVKVTSLTHNELVSIFSDATYGNSMMKIVVANDPHTTKVAASVVNDPNIDTECREDLWAEILLNGGSICVVDTESGAKDKDDAFENAYHGEAHNVGFTELNEWFSGTYGATTYDINLEEFLRGCSKENAYELLREILDGDGDMWTAYNLMQIITFGEEIYG